MDVLENISLEPNFPSDNIDRFYRLGVWKQSISKPRVGELRNMRQATSRVKHHIYSAQKKLRNISLPPEFYKASHKGLSASNTAQGKHYLNENLIRN